MPLHDIAQERVEHEQRPQRRAVVAQSGLVLVDQVAEVVPVEESGVRQPLAEQRLAHALAQRAAEPPRERHGEAHLGPVQHLVRQAAAPSPS